MEASATPHIKSPLISVVVSTFNAEATLQRCIDSFWAQTYPHKELIFSDGKSSDHTVEIFERNASKIAHWISERDTGIYQAWNRVIPKARGEWLYFLGADDYFWSPNVLERVAANLSDPANGTERVVYGQVAVVSQSGEVIEMVGKDWPLVARRYLHEMTIPHQGVFHHRSLFSEYGLFNESFKVCGDYEFLMRELKVHDARFIPDLIITGMQFGGTSSNLTYTRRIIDELKLARRLNDVRIFSFPILFREIRLSLRERLNKLFGPSFTNILADIYRVSVGKPRLWTRKDK